MSTVPLAVYRVLVLLHARYSAVVLVLDQLLVELILTDLHHFDAAAAKVFVSVRSRRQSEGCAWQTPRVKVSRHWHESNSHALLANLETHHWYPEQLVCPVSSFAPETMIAAANLRWQGSAIGSL